VGCLGGVACLPVADESNVRACRLVQYASSAGRQLTKNPRGRGVLSYFHWVRKLVCVGATGWCVWLDVATLPQDIAGCSCLPVDFTVECPLLESWMTEVALECHEVSLHEDPHALPMPDIRVME
jgi:hypothetical protein